MIPQSVVIGMETMGTNSALDMSWNGSSKRVSGSNVAIKVHFSESLREE